MTKTTKLFAWIGGALGVLVLGGLIAVAIIPSTPGFQNFVKEKIETAANDAVGGKLDIGSFNFQWFPMRITLRNVVLHGTEPATEAPLLRVALIQIDLGLFSGYMGLLDIKSLKVDQPQANLIVFPDGKTNIPEPKTKQPPSKNPPLQAVLDLKVGHFDIANGLLVMNAQKQEFHARGENLRAQIAYNPAKPSYEGQVAMNPLVLMQNHHDPVDINLSLPVVLERDRVQLTGAKITTPDSQILVNASVQNLNAPQISGNMTAKIALKDVEKLASLGVPIQTGGNLPSAINADASFNMDQNSISVQSAHVALGDSKIEAAGMLKDPSGNGSVHFNTSLALGQLGRMFKVEAQPEGTFQASGTAKLVGASGYLVDANLNGHSLSFVNGKQRISNINLTGELKADPADLALQHLKLDAFGGEVTGNADLKNMAQYKFDGALHGFDIRSLAKTFAAQDLPYDGVISGPVQASGDIKVPGTKSIQADVHLGIAPGSRGMPVSGKINADFNGASDLISLADSYVALPNSRLDLSGSLDHQLNIKLVSHNLKDFEPALAMGSNGKPQPLPIQLQRGGAVDFTGAVTGNLQSPKIGGHLQVTKFELQDRPFDRFSADLSASSQGARVDNGSLVHGPTQAQFSAAVGLKQWKPENYEPLTANASIRNADMKDLLAIAGQKDVQASGTLNASAQIRGTIGSPQGNANLSVVNGTVQDERFDRLTSNVDFSDQLVRLTNTQLAAGTAHIDMNATFQHPKNSFDTGAIQAHVSSNQMSLDQFNVVRKEVKGLSGTAQINADIAATLQQVKGQSEVLLTSVNANANAHGVVYDGKKLGDLTASAQTAGQNVNFDVTSNFAGSNTHVTGQTQLKSDYPTVANAVINNLSVQQALAVAGQSDIDAKGNLSATAQVSGTLANPNATAQIDLTKAEISGQPLDRVQGRFTYNNTLVDVPNIQIAAGQARIDASARLQHPSGNFEQGQLQFKVSSNQIDLGKLQIIQKQEPGLAGTLQLNADGAGTLRKLPQGSTELPVLFTALNANVGARGLQVNNKPVGDLNLKADTRGNTVYFNLASDVGHSNIQGQGQAQLGGNYPLTAQVSFSNLTYAGLQPLLGSQTTTGGPNFNAEADGNANISGSLLKPQELAGNLTVSNLLFTANPPALGAANTKPIQLKNQGPIVVAYKNQVVTVQSAHITGPSTDINLAGTVSMNEKTPLNLQVTANTNLGILQSLDSDIVSSGNVSTQLAVRGTFAQPLVNGQLRLQNASFNMLDLPNGISNANGVIQFNGTNAVIQNLTGETGGGKLQASGFVGFANGNLRFGLRANASQVRVRTPEGISVTATAAINLTGTSGHSVLGGNVTINKIAFNPKSDFGSLLSRSSPPVETPTAQTGLLADMKLDIRIRTAADMAIQTALAENLQATADLTVRGSAASPGMLGRVTVTSGKLVFFGTTYDVNAGTVSFYNPLSINPILDVDLETKAQGVDVILSVSGPVNDMKLTYRSDPPLQFQEIVALLAAGTTPTSDPTILANQPAPPPQTLQQMGESAIVSQAIAAPLANRLQRVFGVTQLKIDPTFVSGSQLPQARLTLQQQIAKNITFTYITDLAQTNSQIIRVEWSINPQWSAVATRDEFGRFGVDFFFKKQFK